MRRLPVLLIVGLAVTTAGCGGASSGVPPTASQATSPTAEGPATIVMGDFSYAPSSLTVRVGETVTFVNRGKIDHTVADVDANGEIRSKLIKPRPIAPLESQTVVFRTPGTVGYICTYHPTLMSGTITVRE